MTRCSDDRFLSGTVRFPTVDVIGPGTGGVEMIPWPEQCIVHRGVLFLTSGYVTLLISYIDNHLMNNLISYIYTQYTV